MNSSVLISIDLSGNRWSVRMSSFCEKRMINATQEAMVLFILFFRQCGLENWLLELKEILQKIKQQQKEKKGKDTATYIKTTYIKN